MRVQLVLVLCLFYVAAMSGCTRYNTHVTSYLSPELRCPTPGTTTKVAVVAETEPDEPLLETEVARKIGALLTDRGYSVATVEEANYILFAFFTIDSGNTASGVMPVYQGGGTANSYTYTSTGQWANTTTYLPGSTTYVPYNYTYFNRFLGMSLYDRSKWLAAENEDLSNFVVWRATTSSAGSSSDLRSVIDYLLVATFRHFGEDTGERERHVLRKGDKRVRRMCESALAMDPSLFHKPPEEKAESQTTRRPAPAPAAVGGGSQGRMSVIKAAPPGVLYIDIGSGHWIASKGEMGELIILEDNSVWDIDPLDRIYTALWLPTEDITVVEASSELHPYWLINTSAGEKAGATCLRAR